LSFQLCNSIKQIKGKCCTGQVDPEISLQTPGSFDSADAADSESPLVPVLSMGFEKTFMYQFHDVIDFDRTALTELIKREF
jgi:hypothetical protein